MGTLTAMVGSDEFSVATCVTQRIIYQDAMCHSLTVLSRVEFAIVVTKLQYKYNIRSYQRAT